jgi:hypothetical protein
MSDNNKSIGGGFAGIWLLMFLVIKIGGTAFASWSWWWVLLPIIPDLVLIFRKLGWM